MEAVMWFENIWNTPLFWWTLVTVIATVIIIAAAYWWRRTRTADPLKEQVDYFCRCYARGEISRDDFEELKQDLQEFEKKTKPKKQQTTKPLV